MKLMYTFQWRIRLNLMKVSPTVENVLCTYIRIYNRRIKIEIPHGWLVTYGKDSEWKHKNTFPKGNRSTLQVIQYESQFFFDIMKLDILVLIRRLYSIYAWMGPGWCTFSASQSWCIFHSFLYSSLNCDVIGPVDI